MKRGSYMQPNVKEEVLKQNFDSLETVEDVVATIGTLLSEFKERIPTEVVQDINNRLTASPDSVDYAKQQLRYLVNWINR